MFATYVLTLMMAVLHDSGETIPWIDTTAVSAEAIADVCEARPLPGGGKDWCASVAVEMAWHESRFNPEAEGDSGAAKGLFQVHAATLGHPVGDEAADQARGALDLMRLSFAICKERPLEDRLAWYAAGGSGCTRRLELSRSRLHAAARLLRAHPLTQPPTTSRARAMTVEIRETRISP